MHSKIKVALIYGSTRAGRFCDTVASWAKKQITATGKFELSTIDPAFPPARAAGEGNDARWPGQQIGDADAFVVVTPEYNHGYPAGLKSLIDSVGEEWQAKPVAFVSYGGVSGGLRAVEQLRQVFAELHAMTIRDSVSFPNAWEQFGEGDRSHDFGRAERSMTVMLGRLHWWAVALRIA